MPHNLKAPGTRPLERHQWHLTAPPVCRPPPPSSLAGWLDLLRQKGCWTHHLGLVSDRRAEALPGASHPWLQSSGPCYLMKRSREELMNYFSFCYLTPGTLGPGTALRGTGIWCRDLQSQSIQTTCWPTPTPPPRPATSLASPVGCPFFQPAKYLPICLRPHTPARGCS